MPFSDDGVHSLRYKDGVLQVKSQDGSGRMPPAVEAVFLLKIALRSV